MDFNIKRIIRFYDRLSTRLITLTALWVTFIICAIGYQMYLSQQVQTAGAYQYEVGSLPARVYRLNLFADRAFGGEDFATPLTRRCAESAKEIWVTSFSLIAVRSSSLLMCS